MFISVKWSIFVLCWGLPMSDFINEINGYINQVLMLFLVYAEVNRGMEKYAYHSVLHDNI